MTNYVTPVNQYLKTIDLQSYTRYLPNAFDESLSLLEKVNKVIHYMNETNQLSNEMAVKWNEFAETINTRFFEDIENKVNELITNDKIIDLLNDELLPDIRSGLEKTKHSIQSSSGISIEDYKNYAKNVGLVNEDWEPAISKAIQDVKKQGGGNVIFPYGRRRIAKEILLPSNIQFIGFGVDSELWTDIPNLNLIVSENGAVDCSIQSLSIVGSGFGTQPSNLTDNPIVDGSGSGIVFRNVKRGVISGCTIRNHGGDGSSPDKNGVAGVWLTYGCEDCFVIENRVSFCRNGINEDNYFKRDSKNNTIQSNYVENCRFGIATDTDFGVGCKILNNTVKNCSYGAVDINRSSYVLLQGNIFEGNGLTGITDTYSATVTVYSNVFIRQEHVNIDGNIFINNHGWNIKVSSNNYYSSVKNNQIRGGINRGGIIVQGSRYFTVTSNEIVNCNGEGIHANELTIGSSPVSVDGCDISNNLIAGCSEHGINIDKSGRMILSRNRIVNGGTKQDNSYDAIRISGGSSNGVIEGNIIDGVKFRYGIVTSDDLSKNNSIANNRVITIPMTSKYAFGNPNQYYSDNGDFSGNTGATRPVTPFKGQEFKDTVIKKIIWFDGVNWLDSLGNIV